MRALGWLVCVTLAWGCGGGGSEGGPCGDGQLDDGEACDDGNATDGDGCSAGCDIEERACTTDAECADTNACTDDRCGEDGTCAFTNNAAICDDGMFCNGLDRCVDGACSMHDGDPCATGLECANACDETIDTCNVTAGTACGGTSNLCSVTTCDGNGACVGVPANDGTNCGGGSSTICCTGQCITVSSASNCGACGRACASGSCISVASSGVYACGCETSSCPVGQTCMTRAGPDLCQCSTCSGAGICKSVVGSQGANACYY